MKIQKTIHYVLLLILTNSITIHDGLSLAKETAKNSAIIAGSTIGVVSGIITAMKSDSLCASLIVGGMSGILSWYSIDYILYYYFTPDGKIIRGNDIYQYIRQELFSYENLKNSNEVYVFAARQFNTNWPLVEARNTINLLSNKTNEAITLFYDVCAEIASDSLYKEIYQNGLNTIQKLKNYFDTFDHLINLIINHPLFIEQQNMHNQYTIAKAKINAANARMHEIQKNEDRRIEQHQKRQDQVLNTNGLANVNINI